MRLEEYPDLGPWTIPWDLSGLPGGFKGEGPFTSHNGMLSFAFFDGHVKAMKLAATVNPVWLWDNGSLPSPDGNTTIVNQVLQGIQTVNTEYQ